MSFYDGSTVSAESGDVIFHRKGDSYTLSADESGAEYIVISYLCEPDELAEELILDGRSYHSADNLPRYIDLFRAAERVGNVKCSSALLRAKVQEILCYLIQDRERTGIQTVGNYIEAAVGYIMENYMTPITVTDIAKSACCSTSYLRQLFAEHYGISPNKYLTRVRINEAKAMLASGIFTVSEVAQKCGFKNVYYFNRVFKETTGITPGKY